MAGLITTIMSTGMDSFANLFDVIFTVPTRVSTIMGLTTTDTENLSVRINGFTPPELTFAQYTVDYKGIQLKRPAGKIEGAREVSFTFRMDHEQKLYKALSVWKHIWVDPSGEGNFKFGAMSSVDANADLLNYGSIKVIGYNSTTDMGSQGGITGITNAGQIAVTWEFYDVICLNIGTPAYTRNSTEPLTTTAKFLFGRMREPGTSATTNTSIPILPGTPATS